MFTGSISYEGEHAPPQHTVDMAVQCALQLRAQKSAWSAVRLTKGFDLEDGSQAYVLDLEHVWRIHVIPPSEGYESEVYESFVPQFPSAQTATIAGMLSGGMKLVTLKEYPDLDPPGLYINNHNFDLMPESAQLFAQTEASYKLAVEENAAFAPLRDPFSTIIYSQFATIEPGNYTGAMSHVIQLLLGVGNILEYDYEQRWLDAEEGRTPLLASTVDLDPITGELEDAQADMPTSFYTGEGNEQVMVTYDWRWNRTHGIMWGTDNQHRRAPMLVELGQRGVLVMPFPVDEISKTPAGQAHYLQVYPDLGKFTPFEDGQYTLFEALGGFPTGERMPGVKSELDRWVRAGYLWAGSQDLSTFYAGLSMCTGFGWAFHPSGPRAINTMYKYNERGQKVGYCYEVTLTIQEKADVVKVRNTVTPLVIAALGLSDPIDLFKAERLSQDFAEEMVSSPDYDMFDAYEVDPDWTVGVRLFRLREGFLEYPGFQCSKGNTNGCIPVGGPQFKYYEPVMSMVLNFDFETPPGVPQPARSDGPIFATYVDGSAEILHYFNEPGSGGAYSINTRQHCQYVGAWTTGSYSEGIRVKGYFYTSSRDFRQELSTGGGSLRTYTGSIAGDYDFLSFCAFLARHGQVTKRWTGDETSHQRTWSSRNYSVSVSCASNNRSMFFVCEETSEKDIQKSWHYSGPLGIGTSGTYMEASIYNFIFHWTGVCASEFSPPHGSPACVMTFSEPIVANPFACMGTDAPSEFVYSVCCVRDGVPGNWCGGNYDLVITSPKDPPGVIQSAAVTRGPTLPPAHGGSEPTAWYYAYKVWAFGHPLMHNKIIREREEENGSPYMYSMSSEEWWRCSLFACPAYPWRVTANYYGPPYVGTFQEIGGYGWVEFGLKPSVGGGRYFGVVY